LLEPTSYIWQIQIFFLKIWQLGAIFSQQKPLYEWHHTLFCWRSVKIHQKRIKHVNKVCVQTIYFHLGLSPSSLEYHISNHKFIGVSFHEFHWKMNEMVNKLGSYSLQSNMKGMNNHWDWWVWYTQTHVSLSLKNGIGQLQCKLVMFAPIHAW
jgi:hypothetical protein